MMTPFQQFRLWVRRSPGSTRLSAAVAAVLALALLVWSVVPNGTSASLTESGVTAVAPGPSAAGGTTQATAGAAGPAGAPGSSVGTGPASATPSGPLGAGSSATGSAGSVGSAGPAASSGAARSGSQCPPGSNPAVGLSASQIHIGVSVPDIAGAAGNGLFGLPSAQQEEQYYQDVIDAINAAGGVACRRVVASYYTGNPEDPSSLHALCLQMVADHLFFAADEGAFYTPPSAKDCVAQQHLPLIDAGLLLHSEEQQYYPYIFSDVGAYDNLYRNYVFASRDLGVFDPSKGFRKVGLLERDCIPENVNEVDTLLRQIGIGSSRLSVYDVGCPAAFATPAQLEQAVLQFQTAGVTLVMLIDTGSTELPNFTKVAQQQGFHPRYDIPDDGAVAVTEMSESAPDPDNFDSAIAITSQGYGAQNSHVPLDPATQRCEAIMEAHHEQPLYQQTTGIGGVACDQLWIFAAAVAHASVLEPAALATGLDQARQLALSWPDGPADFSGSRVVAGGEYWRTVQWHRGCGCWTLLNPTWKPNYR